MAKPKPAEELSYSMLLRSYSRLRNDMTKLKKKYDKRLKDKLPDAKKEMERRIRLVVKSGCYYHSFAGFYIFREWYVSKGLDRFTARMIVILSYYKYFTLTDFKYWDIFHIQTTNLVNALLDKGYVQKVDFPNKGGKGTRKRRAYVLTPLGMELEKDYEKFYDRKMYEFSKRKDGSDINFQKTFWIKYHPLYKKDVVHRNTLVV